MIEGGNGDKSRTGFYRLNEKGKASLILTGLQISNGLNSSHDGSVIYYPDSATGTIYRAPFEGHESILAGAAPFATFAQGVPDGAAVDADDCYWTAVWGAGRLTQFLPDGQERMHIELPAPQVTCPAFGGTNLSLLLVSSAREGLTAGQLAAAPTSGALFILEAPNGIMGRPVNRFRSSHDLLSGRTPRSQKPSRI